tara:strand:+ start:1232 stop:1765 length:534 start_codon:yes stop_codon:yes gene_type:complete
MANTNAPNGFVPAWHLTGGVIRADQLAIESTYGTAIYSGDVVTLASGLVTQGTATAAPCGVFAGVYYVSSTGAPTFSRSWPASTTTQGSVNAKAYVYTDPDIVYEAQFTTTPTQASVGATYTISTTTGDTTTLRSKEGVTTTTSSGIARCVGFVDRPDNSIGQYARAYFRFPSNQFE